jgi:D-arabinitol dehydrogenase (NADP+)
MRHIVKIVDSLYKEQEECIMYPRKLIVWRNLHEKQILNHRKNSWIPDLSGNDVLIKVKVSGICGTDMHIYEGNYLGDYPVIPGHEFSGVVESVGTEVRRIKNKERVAVEPNISCDNCRFCLHNKQNFCEHWQAIGVTLPGGMACYVKAPEKAVFPINNLSFEEGAFMEPLSCVLHGIEKLTCAVGGEALVIGAGPIGLLLFQVLKLRGFSAIRIVEKDPLRMGFAERLGVGHIYTDVDHIKNKTFDVVIDATGVAAMMRRTIDFAHKGGHILLFGVPPSGSKVEFDAFQIFRKGLSIYASFTSVRNSFEALSILQSGLINVKDLVTHRLSLEEFHKGIALLKNKKELAMKVMVIPEK